MKLRNGDNNTKKMIEVKDIYGNVYSKPAEDLIFRISVYGILRKKDAILVQRYPKIGTYSLPGGRMEIFETIDQALKREFIEETGLIVKPTKLIDVLEKYFTYDDMFFHSVMIFKEVRKIGGKLLNDLHTDDSVDPHYISLDELRNGKIHEAFKEIVEMLI